MTKQNSDKISRREALGIGASVATTAAAGCLGGDDDETIRILEGMDKESTERDAREIRNRLENTESAANDLENNSFSSRVDDYRLRARDDQRGVKATEGFVLGIPEEGIGVQRESNSDSANYQFLEGTKQLGDVTSFEELDEKYGLRGSQTETNIFEDKWNDLQDLALFTRVDTENNQPVLSNDVREQLSAQKTAISNQRKAYEEILKNTGPNDSPMDIATNVENLQNRAQGASSTQDPKQGRTDITPDEWEDLQEGNDPYADIGLNETKNKARNLEERLVEAHTTLAASEEMLDYAIGEADRLQDEYGDGIFDENASRDGKPRDDDFNLEYGDLGQCEQERLEAWYDQGGFNHDPEDLMYRDDGSGDYSWVDPDNPEETSGSIKDLECVLKD